MPVELQERGLLAARVSVLSANATSDDSQVQNGRRYAEMRGIRIVGEAIDLDVSASKVAPWDRPKLGWWLARPHLFDSIIFRGIDRIARNVSEFVALLDWAEVNNKRLVCQQPEIDFSQPVGKLVAIILAVVADMESKLIRDRVLGAREYMRSGVPGEYSRWGASSAPYGYRTIAHPLGKGLALEPDPVQGPIVRWVVDRFLARKSPEWIAGELNKKAIPCPRAVINPKKWGHLRWRGDGVRDILRSESLRAVVTHKGKVLRHRDGEPRRYGKSIVSEPIWYQIRCELDRRSIDRERTHRTSPLLGVVLCDDCKGNMSLGGSTLTRSRGKPTEVREYVPTYFCQNNRTKRKCDSRVRARVRKESLEAYVEGEFLGRFGDLEVVDAVNQYGEDHSVEIAEIEASLDELVSDKYVARIFQGDVGRRRYEHQETSLLSRLEHLKSLPVQESQVIHVPTGQLYREIWDESSVDERRRMLVDVGFRVYVKPGKQGLRDWRSRVRVGRDPSSDYAEYLALNVEGEAV